MKILKKPKLLPIACKRCGCLYHPQMRNLRICVETQVKDEAQCPYCKTANKANFDLKVSEGENGQDI